MKNLLEVKQNELETIDIKNWITKSNELIESTYKLSLQEQRILLVLASKVQPTDETLKAYRFRAKDFVEIIGNKKGTGFYSYLKEVVNGLQTKVLTIKKDGKQRNYSWLITSIYEDNEGYITLQFHPELKNFFLALKEKFTSYQLENVVRLNSVYSIRIYELLKQYERLKRRELSLQDLRELLAIEPTKYKQYGHFKSKVLLVAQKEINQKTDIYFHFNEMKTGRKVIGFEFIIQSKNQKTFLKPNLYKAAEKNEDILHSFPNQNESLIRRQLIDLGLSKDKINWLLGEYPHEQIMRNIQYIKEKNRIGNIKYLSSYLLKAIQEDYAAKSFEWKRKPLRTEKIPDWFGQEEKEREIMEKGTCEEKKQLYYTKRGTQEEFEELILQARELKMRIAKNDGLDEEEILEIGKKPVIDLLISDIKERQKVGLDVQDVNEFKNELIREIYGSLIKNTSKLSI